MPRRAIRIIAIVYGVLLCLTYFAARPPGWMDAITISTNRGLGGTIFGHRFEVRLTVERPAASVLPRMVKAIDVRANGAAADLVCAPVSASLHEIGGR